LLPAFRRFVQIGKLHSAQYGGRFAELDVAIFHDLDAVTPWVEEIEKVAFEHRGAGSLSEFANARTVIDDQTKMPLMVYVRRAGLHERNELVTKVDEGVVFAASAEFERKYPAVEFERGFNVINFERNMIETDKARLTG
jgi:hypothetical protein